MAYDGRQIYRSRNRLANRAINNRTSRYGAKKASNLVVNKIKRNVQNFYNENFDASINIEEVQKTISNIEEMEEIASSKIEEPNFPTVTFIMALAVDTIAVTQLSGFAWFFALLISWSFKVALFFLMWGKVSSSFKMGSKALFKSKSVYRKVFMNYFGKRLAFLTILDSIPFIGVLASDAFFVYLAHKKHKKIVREYMFFVSVVGKVLNSFYKKNRDLFDD
jgi:hypothetical protein